MRADKRFKTRIEGIQSRIYQQKICPLCPSMSFLGSDADTGELDLRITLDTAAQIGFSYPHSHWPIVGVEGSLSKPLQTTPEGLFARKTHPQTRKLLTHWG